jgi:GH15 family glucan-1,4-alpha-glucosidase
MLAAARSGSGWPASNQAMTRAGVFLACSFWLADALSRIGRTREATALFERLLALRNDVGLLKKEYDVTRGRQLGNTPQAFSMVGLINTARLLGGASTMTSARRHEQGLGSTSRHPDPENPSSG